MLQRNQLSIIRLHDNNKPFGGISYEGETALEFMVETGLTCPIKRRVLNKYLNASGIKGISKHALHCSEAFPF